MSPSSPVTVRFNDNDLEKLKDIARCTSFQNNEDYSYSDLIRDAVQKYISDIPNSPNLSTEEHETSNIMSPLQHTESTVSDMSGEDLLDLCGLNFNNPICRVLKKDFESKIKLESIARKVLALDECPQGGVLVYGKKMLENIHILSRRGAVPDLIDEGEEFNAEIFEIAANPTVRINTICHEKWNSLKETTKTAGEVIILEEDMNLINLFYYAAKADKSITFIPDIDIKHIDSIINKTVVNNFIPHNIIMSGVTYDILKAKHKSNGGDPCWQFLLSNSTTETRSTLAGKYRDATIMITPRAYNNIYLVNKNCKTGTFSTPPFNDISVMLSDETKKIRVGLIYCISLGMFVVSGNVSVIELSDENKNRD
jgi:hypothetical protein